VVDCRSSGKGRGSGRGSRAARVCDKGRRRALVNWPTIGTPLLRVRDELRAASCPLPMHHFIPIHSIHSHLPVCLPACPPCPVTGDWYLGCHHAPIACRLLGTLQQPLLSMSLTGQGPVNQPQLVPGHISDHLSTLSTQPGRGSVARLHRNHGLHLVSGVSTKAWAWPASN
jgi:hypothetical protein